VVFEMGKVICINNNKGGVLKSTTTTNLAGVLATQGYKVLVVDVDYQSNVALSFGLNPDMFRTSIYDVLLNKIPAEEAIIKVHKNIDILPSNRDLISFEFRVIGDNNKYPEPFYLMVDNLSHLREQYDYILIDTPPSLGVMNGNVFTFSDHVLIPFAPELISMRSLKEVIYTITELKELHNPELEILGVLRTLVNGVTNLHQDIIQETNKYSYETGIKVFETIIPVTIQFSNSISYHKVPATLLPEKKRKSASFDKSELYYELWYEMAEQLEGSAVK
jgi:chromosome partitioning protein